jgi:hypothetical protein
MRHCIILLGEYFDLILNFGPNFMSTIGMGLLHVSDFPCERVRESKGFHGFQGFKKLNLSSKSETKFRESHESLYWKVHVQEWITRRSHHSRHEKSEEAEEGRSPLCAQFGVHLRGEQRERRAAR